MADDGQFADLDGPALQAWLAREAPEAGSLRGIAKFPGGQSNPTYRVDCAEGPLVLRRKPFGPLLPSAHAIEREYRLLSALHPTGFPIARPLCLCEDSAVIGASFYLMELVDGRIFWDGKLPEAQRSERRPIYHSLIETLARLHTIDPDSIGLAGFGAQGDYFERQVGRWTRQYRAAETETIDEVERLIAWLPSTMPAQSGVSIIHGDYRIDNLVYERETSRVAGVLDWELATLGDPLADFAYVALNWVLDVPGRRSQLGGIDLAAEAIPDLDEIVALYCRLTGRQAMPDLNWYFAYSLFRLVGILQGIRKRILDGNASSRQAEETASRIRPLAEQAWQFARAAGA